MHNFGSKRLAGLAYTPMQSQGGFKKPHAMALDLVYRAAKRAGTGRGLSQAPPGPGWAGKRPKIDEFRSYPPPPPPEQKPKTRSTALEFTRGSCIHRTRVYLGPSPKKKGRRIRVAKRPLGFSEPVFCTGPIFGVGVGWSFFIGVRPRPKEPATNWDCCRNRVKTNKQNGR
jgi:hypothetical protein